MHLFEFKIKNESNFLDDHNLISLIKSNELLLERVKTGDKRYENSLGWHNVDEWAGKEQLDKYDEIANEIRKNAEVLVVVGVGGSNQSARAVYDALDPKDVPELIWIGNNLSVSSINNALDSIRGRSAYVNLISKSFETIEPGVGFRVMRDYLRRNYGKDYSSRIICTGTPGTKLEKLALDQNYRFLPFPKNIGGRFDAISPVGLFPLAVAGVDIHALAKGASEMRESLMSATGQDNPALLYATVRNELYKMGFKIEMLSFFEPGLMRFAKWWIQLYGESEGKDGKGIFPTMGNFSEDLHSLGQYIQDGSNIVYETFINVNDGDSLILSNGLDDGFEYIGNKDVFDINKAAYKATLKAHSKRFPCFTIDLPSLNAESMGQLFYFFEFACYLSCEILGVNPFNQPGVETYKKDMFKLLGKI